MKRAKPATDQPEANEAETVEARTTIQYTAPLRLPRTILESAENEPTEEPIDEEPIDEELDEDSEVEKSRRNVDRDSTDAIRKRLAKAGVVPLNLLPLTIERMTSDAMSGTRSPRVPLKRLLMTEAQYMAGEHIPYIEAFGPGRYWLTLRPARGPGSISCWEHIVNDPNGAPPQTSYSAFANQAYGQPVSPPPAAPQSAFGNLDEIEKLLELMAKLDKIRGPQSAPAAPAAASTDPEIAMAAYLMKDPSAAKKIVKNLFGGESDDSSTFNMILTNAEPIGKALQGIVETIFANVHAVRGNSTPPTRIEPTRQPPTIEQPQRQTEAETPEASPAQTFAADLIEAINNAPDLAQLSPNLTAYNLVNFSDRITAAGFTSIAHFLESLALSEFSEAIKLLEELGQTKLTADPQKVSVWFAAFQPELATYFAESPE